LKPLAGIPSRADAPADGDIVKCTTAKRVLTRLRWSPPKTQRAVHLWTHRQRSCDQTALNCDWRLGYRKDVSVHILGLAALRSMHDVRRGLAARRSGSATSRQFGRGYRFICIPQRMALGCSWGRAVRNADPAARSSDSRAPRGTVSEEVGGEIHFLLFDCLVRRHPEGAPRGAPSMEEPRYRSADQFRSLGPSPPRTL